MYFVQTVGVDLSLLNWIKLKQLNLSFCWEFTSARQPLRAEPGFLPSKDKNNSFLIYLSIDVLMSTWVTHYKWHGTFIPYGILISIKKNLTFCNGLDGPREYYAKLNKSDRERQIPYFTYVWNLNNKINKIETDSDTESRLMVNRREGNGGGGWEGWRD